MIVAHAMAAVTVVVMVMMVTVAVAVPTVEALLFSSIHLPAFFAGVASSRGARRSSRGTVLRAAAPRVLPRGGRRLCRCARILTGTWNRWWGHSPLGGVPRA